MVVEVAGETASGKTQLCLLAAAAAALQGHEVMFVDTTGSFKPDRVVQLAEGLVTGGSGSAAAGAAGRHDPAELAQHLGGCIHVHRAANVFELLTFLDRLDVSLQVQQLQQAAADGGAGGMDWAPAGPRLLGPRLLVVDSVSALLSTLLGNAQHTQGRFR